MAKMFGFMTALRSVSQGRAGFSMEFSHFEKKAER
jgi:elongation factor G